MEDFLAQYCAASAARDFDTMMKAVAQDAVLVSPLSGRAVFRGHDDLRILLTAVYSALSDSSWEAPIGTGDRRVVIGHAKIGPVQLTDAMIIDLDADGRIRRFGPHLRPWLALTLVAVRLLPTMLRHPAVMRRSMQTPDRT
ncbi:nuclear transport factor 2 family protein [Nocardia sp. XZ_19_385]|uniref:nuclear transport factor 2 family protein n=1 Tax=Nocardia sp. XZ_19_385 TaxID=2769488 RepID=UPI00188FD0DC|nr:nuclear transport factor 2 family protein [Nocardia sp. XZ_19_385]